MLPAVREFTAYADRYNSSFQLPRVIRKSNFTVSALSEVLSAAGQKFLQAHRLDRQSERFGVSVFFAAVMFSCGLEASSPIQSYHCSFLHPLFLHCVLKSSFCFFERSKGVSWALQCGSKKGGGAVAFLIFVAQCLCIGAAIVSDNPFGSRRLWLWPLAPQPHRRRVRNHGRRPLHRHRARVSVCLQPSPAPAATTQLRYPDSS